MAEQLAKYQLIPDLTDEEYLALKADIEKRGILIPVEIDKEGNILDGHHRAEICNELGTSENDCATENVKT